MAQDLRANKQNAIDFYRTAYLGDPVKAVELYVGAEYIQHNRCPTRRKTAILCTERAPNDALLLLLAARP